MLKDRSCYRFLSAKWATAELLASAYPKKERLKHYIRFNAILSDASAGNRFFVIVRQGERALAVLHLCREKRHPFCFRIRGLHTHQDFRGRSLATSLLRLGCKSVAEFYGAEEVYSFILPENTASLVAHAHAGFTVSTDAGNQSERHRMFVWRRKGR